jgi:hypothetical protein
MGFVRCWWEDDPCAVRAWSSGGGAAVDSIARGIMLICRRATGIESLLPLLLEPGNDCVPPSRDNDDGCREADHDDFERIGGFSR